MIALDASVLIAFLAADDRDHEAAARVLRESAKERFVASVLTIAELLVGPVRHGRLEPAQLALRRLGVHEIRLPDDAAPRLAGLRVAMRLKLPDCAVLIAAQDAGASTVATFDDALAAAAVEHGFDVLPKPQS